MRAPLLCLCEGEGERHNTKMKRKKKKISERFGFRRLTIAASLGLIAVAVLDGKLVFGKPSPYSSSAVAVQIGRCDS